MTDYQTGSMRLLLPLKPWLEKPTVSEILINEPETIFIEDNGTMHKIPVPEMNADKLPRLFQLIASENQMVLNDEKPMLSGSLPDGSRVQLVLPPTAKHPTLSIRRQSVNKLTLNDYQNQDYYRHTSPYVLDDENTSTQTNLLNKLYHAKEWGEFIHQAILARKNIIISGGTSSGKTTFLNACLQAIHLTDRLIILEDTREVEVPHDNQVQLLASKHEQGKAKVTMQDLVQCCLRLRPDRIIMGEIRGKEILDFVSACSTGHEGSLTTIHANSPRIAFMRMTQMYKLNNVPAMTDEDILRELKEVIDIIIQVEKIPTGRIAKSIYYKDA